MHNVPKQYARISLSHQFKRKKISIFLIVSREEFNNRAYN